MADETLTDLRETPPTRASVTIDAHPNALTAEGIFDRIAHRFIARHAPAEAIRPGTTALHEGSRDAYTEWALANPDSAAAAPQKRATPAALEAGKNPSSVLVMTPKASIDPFGYGPGVRQFVDAIDGPNAGTHLATIASTPIERKHLAMADVVLAKTGLASVITDESYERIQAEVGERILQRFDHLPDEPKEQRPDAAKTAGFAAAKSAAELSGRYVVLANWQKDINASFAPEAANYLKALKTAEKTMGKDAAVKEPGLGIPPTPAKDLGRAEEVFGKAVQKYAYDQSRWENSRLSLAMQERVNALKHYADVAPKTARFMTTNLPGQQLDTEAKHAVFAQLRADVREEVRGLQEFAAERNGELSGMQQSGAGKEQFGLNRRINNGPTEQPQALQEEARSVAAQLAALTQAKYDLSPVSSPVPEYLQDLAEPEPQPKLLDSVGSLVHRTLSGVASSRQIRQNAESGTLPSDDRPAARIAVSPWAARSDQHESQR